MKKFFVKDRSGRGYTSLMSAPQIESSWDLDYEDYDTEQTLRDFLEESWVGLKWKRNAVEITRVN